jgi:HSP20 family protein
MLFLPTTRRALPVRFSRHFDSLLDDTLDSFFVRTSVAPAADATRAPAMDISESDSAYTVTLDVPGLTREQLKVSVEGKRVSIEAAASSEEEVKHGDGVRALYRERSTRRYARSFTLPVEVDQDSSQAKLENGVLSLTLAKKVASGAKQISVN